VLDEREPLPKIRGNVKINYLFFFVYTVLEPWFTYMHGYKG